MLLVLDLGLTSLVLVISFLVLPLIGFVVVRRKWRLAALRREEIRRLLIHASEEAARVEREASVEFSFVPVVTNSFYCPVCFCPALTRCSRCKAVRYWYVNIYSCCMMLAFNYLGRHDEFEYLGY